MQKVESESKSLSTSSSSSILKPLPQTPVKQPIQANPTQPAPNIKQQQYYQQYPQQQYQQTPNSQQQPYTAEQYQQYLAFQQYYNQYYNQQTPQNQGGNIKQGQIYDPNQQSVV